MQIDESDEQPSNPRPSITETLEPDSKVTAASDWHFEKQRLQILSTDE
jgi:hypothetical protein